MRKVEMGRHRSLRESPRVSGFRGWGDRGWHGMRTSSYLHTVVNTALWLDGMGWLHYFDTITQESEFGTQGGSQDSEFGGQGG